MAFKKQELLGIIKDCCTVFMRIIGIRIYQFFMKLASTFLPKKKQCIFKGEKELSHLCFTLSKHSNNVLLLIGPNIKKRGYEIKVANELAKFKLSTFTFVSSSKEPSIEMVKEAYSFFSENKCDCIFAIGGGSIIDLAKAVKAMAANKEKPIFGLLKVKRSSIALVAAPTTAGTGSEATLAAVIKDEDGVKKTILSPRIVPDFIYFNPSFLSSLPSLVASSAGLDAFTHAVESFISKGSTISTRKNAKKSLVLFKDNFAKFMANRNDYSSCMNMLLSSYYAGLSFTRAYVGYAHSIGHALGASYNIPHGIAVINSLLYILPRYGNSIKRRKKQIESILGIDVSLEEYISSLLKECDISPFKLEIDDNKAKSLALLANKETIPLYPVPKIFDIEELSKFIKDICEGKL